MKNKKHCKDKRRGKNGNIDCNHLVLAIPIKDSKITKNLLINRYEIEINEKKLGCLAPGIIFNLIKTLLFMTLSLL